MASNKLCVVEIGNILIIKIKFMPEKIKNITARQILDSRGDPTVKVKVELASGGDR